MTQKDYDHTFKHLLETRWLGGQKSGNKIFRHWKYIETEASASDRRDMPAGQASQEEGISSLQRHEETKKKRLEMQSAENLAVLTC